MSYDAKQSMRPIHRAIVFAYLTGALPSIGLAVESELNEFLLTPVRDSLFVYRRWIGPTKGQTCLMTPSDSAYATQSFRAFGFFGGLWRTADRLHRCGHDTQDYPIVETASGLRYNDPVPTPP